MDCSQLDRRALILHYSGISAQRLREKDLEKRRLLEEECRTLEMSLGMSPEEIIHEAAEILPSLRKPS